jgi:hypothetical protein
MTCKIAWKKPLQRQGPRKINHNQGADMATKKPFNPFTKPDTKKNEAAEKKMAPTKKGYAAMEKKYEGKRSTSKK